MEVVGAEVEEGVVLERQDRRLVVLVVVAVVLSEPFCSSRTVSVSR
jgi:hypothetical protein